MTCGAPGARRDTGDSREARDAAARGEGRVVVVIGEPGIGKTALVTRFLGELEAGARVLVGSCDDLSIPRPLGPVQDLVRNVSPELAQALAAGDASHEIHGLLLEELRLPPQPTVLVVEDVHWADDATLDAITVLVRRIGSLPALVILTCRDGEVPPGHPIHAAVDAARAENLVFLELEPLAQACCWRCLTAAKSGCGRSSAEVIPCLLSRSFGGSRVRTRLPTVIGGAYLTSCAGVPICAALSAKPDRHLLEEVHGVLPSFSVKVAVFTVVPSSSVPLEGLGRDDSAVRGDLAVLAMEAHVEAVFRHHHVAPPAADPQVDHGDRARPGHTAL